MQVEINGAKYDIFGGLTIKKSFAELGTMYFTIVSKTRLTLAKYMKVDYYILWDIQVEKTKHEYVYTCVAIEPTKILDEVVLNGYADSGAGTVADMVSRVITRSGLNAKISYATRLLLKQKSGEEFVFSGLTTLREILDAYMSLFDYRVEMTSNLDIRHTDLNAKGLLVEIPEKYATDLDSEYATNGIVSIASNVFGGGAIEPYKKLTSDKAFFNYDDAFYSTTYKINKVKKLFINVKMRFKYEVAGSANYFDFVSEVDITKYCVDKKEYDTLDIMDKYSRLYYTQNDKKISGFLDNNNVSFLNDLIVIDGILQDKFLTDDDFKNTVLTAAGVTDYQDGQTLNVYRGEHSNMLVKCEYDYVENLLFDVKGNKNFYPLANTRTIDNQSESKVNLSRYVANLKSKCDKIGNKVLTFVANNVIINIGDYTIDNYILSEYTRTYFDDLVQCNYHFTENYNALNTATKINRENRVYTIELENYIDTYKVIDNVSGNHNYCMIKSNSMDNYVIIPMLNYSDFACVKFLDNYACATELITVGSHKEVRYIPYADASGETESFDMILFSDLSKKADDYPFVTTDDIVGEYEEFSFNFKKDRLERLVLVFKKGGIES